MSLTTNDMIMQWVIEDSRYRGEGEPSRLDLMFTKGIDLAKDIEYQCPIRKNNHVMLEMVTRGDSEVERDKSHKKNRHSYAEATFNDFKQH